MSDPASSTYPSLFIMDACFATTSSVHPTASSFSSNTINADVRSLSLNLIVPPSFSFPPSNGDSTHPAPSSPKTEGSSSNDADIVRASDLSPMGISVAEGQLTIIHDRDPTAASMRSFDLLAHIPPCAFTTYSADVFLRNRKGSLHAQEAKLVTVKRFVKKNGTRHRCLVLLTRDGISLRVDRHRDHTLSLPRFILRLGNSDATDTVTMSRDTHLLTDRRLKEEATLELSLQVSLLDFMRILEVVLDECNSYSLFGENCWQSNPSTFRWKNAC
ncbi:uncharacterized protein EI90DRAFT_907044 [Cantharellus anzutake]|uniref:uncharacterized protein n=1 Tax=Cantharellus anzutake TaxID=1750568 RepID=UPI001907C918|nr:uncharacterized protein EI90DRAFT_907044 [Cantharellus anzutake]KAF8331964.1 hypothetical protein EI90DRAFT_907044 [Cantharellus anzutake]